MKRWKTVLAGAALAVCGLTGCKQRLYMSKTEHDEMKALGLPVNFENDNHAAFMSPTGEGHKPPPTVLDPDRPARYLSLPEAFAIALEQGTEGQNGAINETLPTLQFGLLLDDNVRVFALDPATAGANIESALSKFDARWITSLTWQKQDNAVANTLANFNNGDIAQISTGFYKPLPTGGVSGITFETDYQRLSNVPSGFAVVNPAYRPQITAIFEQPLLQNWGVDINQLLPTHPGSVQIPGLVGGTSATGAQPGILVTRLRFDESRIEFERRLNDMVTNVERAYWNLYSAYFALYAAEQGMRQSYVTYQLTQTLEQAGTRARQEVAQVRAQFEDFRSQRLTALGQVLEAERQLRGLLSLPTEDGARLVPADAPTLAPYQPEWSGSVTEMLANRPELQLIRNEVKARQFDVILQKNYLRPDLRFVSSYNVNGIGTRLDGSTVNGNAFGNLADNKFNSWTAGLRANVPLGFRDANAQVRVARLNLARTYISLKSQELKGERLLQQAYQQIAQSYEVIRAQRNRRVALSQQLSGLAERVRLGKDPVLVLLDAQRNYAAALATEHRAIADYNIAIAVFQFAKGTILTYNNVNIAEGALPPLTLARAVDHYEQRTNALVAREKAAPPAADHPPTLPSLFSNAPKLPDVPEEWHTGPNSRTPYDPLSNFNPAAPAGTDPRTLPQPGFAPAPQPGLTQPMFPQAAGPLPRGDVLAPTGPTGLPVSSPISLSPAGPGQPVPLPPTGTPLSRP